MINTSEHKNEDIVKSGVVDYPIGFPFYFNPDRTPQLLVKIGDEELRFNHNFELSEDKGSVVLRPTEEESWTLEGPEDFSWMAKWDGKDLLIERAVPFVQDSDYQLGRISSEQIERDFDLSVMRDQELRNQADKDREAANEQVEQLRKDMDDEFAAVDSRFDFVQEQTDAKFAEVDSRIDDFQEQTDAKFAETDIAISGLAVGVTANEAAIQETREDFASADQAIREDFASADQAIRDDMNAKDSRLQTQITAQAAEIATKQGKLTAGDNIIISGNVISATGAGGGAGFDIVVVQELPATGQKGIIYLLAKDGSSPDVYDEYVWITATQTFELIGSTKVDLSGYLPLSGGELTGPITFSSVAQLSVSDPLFGQFFIGSVNNPKQFEFSTNGLWLCPSYDAGGTLGREGRRWHRVYTMKLNNGADLELPTEAGTLARVEDISDALSKSLANNSTASRAIATGLNATATQGGTAIGADSQAGNYAVAVGDLAKATGKRSVQLGKGTNADAGTLKFGNDSGNYTVLDVNGIVPAERMSSTAGTTGQVLTKTDTGMEWQEPQGGGTKIIIKRYN